VTIPGSTVTITNSEITGVTAGVQLSGAGSTVTVYSGIITGGFRAINLSNGATLNHIGGTLIPAPGGGTTASGNGGNNQQLGNGGTTDPGNGHVTTPDNGAETPPAVDTGEGAGDISVITGDDYTVTLPPALEVAEVSVEVETTSPDELEAIDGIAQLAAVTVEVAIDGQGVTELPATVTITVYLGDDLADAIAYNGLNTSRIIAVAADGTLIGGTLDIATGGFVFETEMAGGFTIQYVENLTRVVLQMGSPVAICSAGNAPTQIMDVPPQVTPEGSTVLPLRAMGYLLGADVFWDAATDSVTLTLGGRSLTFAIGTNDSLRIEGRTMVPVRFIAEFFGATVNWDAATGNVEILMGN
jgi:hypothetical protein